MLKLLISKFKDSIIEYMSYDIAINKAWADLAQLKPLQKLTVKFLADEYSLDLESQKAFSLSCNIPAKDFSTILILHYLIKSLKGLPGETGEWLTFREISGVEGYFPAFRKRSIEPIVKKYGKSPDGIFSVLERLPSRKADSQEPGVIIEAFKGVPVLIKVFAADDEFGPDANIYFDRSIKEIFCTEDIVVLAGFVASQL